MRPTGSDILVVDDEADIRDLVSGLLEDEGHAVRVAANSDEALAAIRARKPSLAILDIWMQGGGLDGLELLEVVKEIDPDLPVVMISGHGNIETAVTALKRGAYDFIEKPFKSDRLVVVVERAIEAATLKRENRRLRAQTMTPSGLIGRSQAAQALRSTIAKVAQANSRVLISGPAGSGKELVARQIHEASPRARRVRRHLGRRNDARATGRRTVRGRGTGRPAAQDRGVRAGAQRHPLSGRDQRHAA
jgi:two-component system, NtrC family, nitrogen regulation response regulator NtrX